MSHKKIAYLNLLLSFLIMRSEGLFVIDYSVFQLEDFHLRRVRDFYQDYITRKNIYEKIWEEVQERVVRREGYSAEELSRQLRIAAEEQKFGISEVVWISQESGIYQKIIEVQKRLKAKFGDKLKLVPAPFLHLTILGLLLRQEEQIAPELVNEIKAKARQVRILPGTQVYLEGVNFSPEIGVFIQGYEKDGKITKIRRDLQSRIPTAVKAIKEPAFHVTLAYVTREISAEEVRELVEVIKDWRNEVFGWFEVNEENTEPFYHYNSLFTRSEKGEYRGENY